MLDALDRSVPSPPPTPARLKDRPMPPPPDYKLSEGGPFFALHLLPLLAIFTGTTWVDWAVCFGLFFLRMFAITGFYHRYFSHRGFETSRTFRFVMAFLGCTASQRGPIWWAAQHRHHHLHSDSARDVHSPRQRGVLWSHMLWFTTRGAFDTPSRYVRDWLRVPELRWLERWNWIPPLVFASLVYASGEAVAVTWPASGTSGLQALVWGYGIATVVLYHATYTINSLAHRFGTRRFETGDDSRNNFWLALLTLGEGWHNNHHHYPSSARQGFYWWEIDLTYYGLVMLSSLGLIRNLRPVPRPALVKNRRSPRSTEVPR
ncbi:MAG: acyl-CoA desaturase [Planctomycetes bacterium]|nr:acyl-CoA desaturase [Planctomycetota bacterium]